MLTATSDLNHSLSQPLKPLEKVSERRVSVVPAGDGSAGVVATSVDIFAVLGAKGLLGRKAALFVPLPVRMSVRSIVFLRFSLNNTTSSKEQDKNTFSFQSSRLSEYGPDSACDVLGILLCVDGQVGRIRRMWLLAGMSVFFVESVFIDLCLSSNLYSLS